MSKLTLKQVQKSLIRLSLHYPASDHDATTLEVLAEDYHDDLLSEHVSRESFLEGIKLFRKSQDSTYFPNSATMLEYSMKAGVKLGEEAIQNAALLLTESGGYKSDFDILKNKTLLTICAKQASKKIDSKKASRLVEAVSQCKTQEALDDYADSEPICSDIMARIRFKQEAA